MRKSSLIVAVLVILSALFLGVSLLPEARALTLYVGGPGPGNYTTISSAISAANAGDTVYVYNGTYSELIFISKTISLVGENRDTTIIDGFGNANVIYVTADWVNVTNFTIKRDGGDDMYAGINLNSVQNCHVTDNIITNNYQGIYLQFSRYNTIRDNVIKLSREKSAYFYFAHDNIFENNDLPSYDHYSIRIVGSNRNEFTNNSLYSNTGTGFSFQGSDNNTLSNNIIQDNSRGFYLYLSDSNDIVGNEIVDNTEGMVLSVSNDNTIASNNVSNNLNKGIRIVSSSRGNSIANNTISSNGEHGIYLNSSSSNTIIDNIVSLNSGHGIRVDSSNSLIMARNTVHSNGMNGIRLWNCKNDTILGNNITENFYGVHLIRSDNGAISDNEISRNSNDGIYLFNSHNNRIINNTASLNSPNGISLDSSNYNAAVNNTLSNSTIGIVLLSARRNTVIGNEMVRDGILVLGDSREHFNTHTIEPSNTVNGRAVYYWKNVTGGSIPSDAGEIIVANCTDVIIENQNIDNGTVGIELGFSSNITITDSVLLSNRWGVFAIHSNGNLISSVNASDNWIGIHIDSSQNNTISEGVFSSNDGYGIHLFSSINSNVYHNKFLGNSNQAYDDTDTNQWDDSYPSGGNYWSDYAGSDSFSGPDQDQPGSDGIGDTPFQIDLDSEDRYPLMAAPGDVEPPRVLQVLLNGKASQTYALEDVPLLNLTATVDDTETGNSTIGGANCTLEPLNWSSSQPMTPLDGVFNSSLEVVYSVLSPPSEVGLYRYCVYAWDGNGNFNMTSIGCAVLNISIPPSSPSMIGSILSGLSSQDLTITWGRSGDDGAGTNYVTRYDIYRSQDHAGLYEVVANVSANSSLTYEWTCGGCGEGDSNGYFFYVAANDSALSSQAPNRVAKFTRPLAPGPNLISIPLIQSDESIETVLQTVKYDNAWFHDPSSGEWNWYMKDKTYSGGLSDLNHTMGMWVNVTEASNLTVAGIVPAQTTIHLYEGWNLVSFPSLNSSYTVADLKAETGATRVEGYDPAPPYFLRVLGDAEALQAGYGYWVKVQSDAEWTVPFG